MQNVTNLRIKLATSIVTFIFFNANYTFANDSMKIYNVDGTYLGQHSSEFIKILKLKDSDYSLRTSYVPNTKIVTGQFLELRKKINKSTINGINFDYEKRLTMLFKFRIYANTPDWNKIKTKLISKYGKANIDRYGQSGKSYIRMGTRYGLCWGECKQSDFADGFVKCRDGGTCMTVIYHTNQNGEKGPVITQKIMDGKREKRSSEFYWKQKKLHAESDF